MALISRWLVVVVALFASASFGAEPGASVTPERLVCEYRENPEGIAPATPRLSWRLRSTDPAERGVFLSGYQVVAAETREALEAGRQLLWDSGVVQRDAGKAGAELVPLATRAEYGGKPLVSKQRVWWKVRVWDQTGRASDWSEPASFGMGLLEQTDWMATWIGLDDAPTGPLTPEVREQLRRMPWIRLPGPPARVARTAFFRTEFELSSADIKEAWIAGTADMIGEVQLNGTVVGELARWELVRPIDVKSALVPGRNALGVRVEHHDGFNPAVTGMLVVRFADGNEQRVLIDKRWKLTEEAKAAWARAGFDDSGWKPVEEAAGQAWGGSRNTEHFMGRAPYLRTTFTPEKGKTIRRAMLYATALGVYECRLNGARVGNAEFAPGWTEYTKRVEHQTYDVTPMITPGVNCLGAVVGDGWYAGLMGYTGQRRHYRGVGGGPARFLAQLEIEYTDGTRQTIASGPGWQASFGPILYTDNYMGSGYDSRLEMPGWDTPTYNASSWKPVDAGLSEPARRELDVTARVQGAMRDGRVTMLVGPKALGDPAYGVVKTLRVEYTAGGRGAVVAMKEGETLSLPRDGESGVLTITRAVFGELASVPLTRFVIEPQRGDPVRRFEELGAKGVTEPRPGRYVFDLEQNMVGWTRLKVSGASGQRLVVRHAEMLNPDGTLYTSNLRGATATDFFTLKGGAEVLEPAFTFHGFRYVEITGLTAKPDASMLTGIVAHTAMTPTGTFTCSSPLVNQLVHNIEWGQKGNYFDVPTDCPQRDERLGWTGDAQFFVNTAAYSFDIASFMSRWLKTLNQDAQFEDGTFAHVAPKVNERGGSTAWGDAAIVCTHALYEAYADARVISDNYDAMCRYMVWLDGKTKDGITKVGGFGDWLNLKDPTSQDLIDTAYRAELCRLMSEMAGVIHKDADAAKFRAAHMDTVAAFRTRFVAPEGSLKESGQTGYALAFTMGLIPEDLREKSAAHFAAAIEKKDWHLATGFIGTPRLLPALYSAERGDVAARLLMNEDYPSWLYQVKLGATTMWERWDGWTPEKGFSDVGMNSFNHYAFGSVGNALYGNVAGISALAPGYARVLIAPTVTPGLTYAKATYDSAAGMVKSAWRWEMVDNERNRRLVLDATMPPNVTGEIDVPLPRAGMTVDNVIESGRPLKDSWGVSVIASAKPGGAGPAVLRLSAGPGTYHFIVDWDK